MTSSIAFESLYRKLNDRSKAIEFLLTQLFERCEAEEKYAKQLEKISSQMNSSGGDIDDLLQGLKIDLNQKANYNRGFVSQIKADLEASSQELKKAQSQFRSQCSEIVKLDKEVKMNYDKYEKQRDRYNKIERDTEEASLVLQAAMWNKEATNDQRLRAHNRLQNLLQSRQEVEGQVKVFQTYYNNSMQQSQNLISKAITGQTTTFNQLFNLVKDLSMKILVCEISRARNLQYDCEQFFSSMEKYEEPQSQLTQPITGQQLLLIQAKEELPISIQQNYQTFMRVHSDRIAQNNKIMTGNRSQSSEMNQLENLKHRTIQLISKYHDRPLDKEHYSVQGQEKYLSFIRLGVEQSLEEEVNDWKDEDKSDVDISQLSELFNQQIYRDLGIIILESFRTAGQSVFQFNNTAYKKLSYFLTRLLDGCVKEGDTRNVKRAILMANTLCKENKVYLIDSIQHMKMWKQMDTWEALIYTSIEDEIDKSGTLQNREQIFKDKHVIFTNLLTNSLNMINFKVDKQEIKNIIQKFGKIFQLYDLQIQELNNFVDSDGKISVSKNVNSIQVLQTLYQSNEQTKVVNNPNSGPKKVLIFGDKKGGQQPPPNPLGNRPGQRFNSQMVMNQDNKQKLDEDKSKNDIKVLRTSSDTQIQDFEIDNSQQLKKDQEQQQQQQQQQQKQQQQQQQQQQEQEQQQQKQPQNKKIIEQLAVELPDEKRQPAGLFRNYF